MSHDRDPETYSRSLLQCQTKTFVCTSPCGARLYKKPNCRGVPKLRSIADMFLRTCWTKWRPLVSMAKLAEQRIR